LRKIIRKPNDIYWPNINENPVKYISEYFSFPEWLINRWIKRYGLDLCINICQIMNKKPLTILRINPLRANMSDLQKKLSNLVVSFQEGQYLPFESLILEEFVDITGFEIFKSGLFSIQDESSSLASRLLDPLPGELIIDMCSGPGGKTTHLAQLMNNQGKIIAFEKNKKRLDMVKGEASRLGISNIKYFLQDATIFCADFLEKADKVLVDAPCSGTGVIRKKPDIKWKNINDRQLQIFTNLQMEILNVASKYLRPGGKLVYSTCSIEKEENDCIIKKFLKKNPCFTIQETSSFVKEYGVVKYTTSIKQAIQLLPGYSGENIDGFYMAKLKKKMAG
jgi:16S rRNA (cytosine967-C5)-methyltransferase